MKGLSEKRLSDYMAEQIADEILAGRIEGGSQLKQEELAEVFGASRIPIREAFQVLESQGPVSYTHLDVYKRQEWIWYFWLWQRMKVSCRRQENTWTFWDSLGSRRAFW